MAVLYRTLKNVWRVVVPKKWSSLFFNGRTPFSKVVLRLKGIVERRSSHDDIYDEGYYQKRVEEMSLAAEGIAPSLQRWFAPSTVLDVGCGTGELIESFGRLGVKGKGLEYSDAALKICHSKNIEVRKFDLEGDQDPPAWKADLVVSTEVAEHLPSSAADKYVRALCQMAQHWIVITAATPGQGGTDHVNEQPNEYWIKKFKSLSVDYSEDLTRTLRDEWQKNKLEPHRAKNVMVFSVGTKA